MDVREVAERYFTTVNAGDWEGWLALFADDAVLIEPIGTISGIDQLRQGVGALQKGYRTFHNYLIELIVDGERVVALTHISAVTRGGAPVELDVANVYRIRGGKIVEQRNFLDPAPLKPFLDELAKG